jgi:hypothetical protein
LLRALAAWALIADASVLVTDPLPPGAALRVLTRASRADTAWLTTLTAWESALSAETRASVSTERPFEMTERAFDIMG